MPLVGRLLIVRVFGKFLLSTAGGFPKDVAGAGLDCAVSKLTVRNGEVSSLAGSTMWVPEAHPVGQLMQDWPNLLIAVSTWLRRVACEEDGLRSFRPRVRPKAHN